MIIITISSYNDRTGELEQQNVFHSPGTYPHAWKIEEFLNNFFKKVLDEPDFEEF